MEHIDHSLVVKAVRVIFLHLTEQMDCNNPLVLLRCSETFSVNLHFRCSCHWLQRAVIDFLNGVNTQLKRIISKARVITAKIRKSTIEFPMLVNNDCFILAPNDTRKGSIYKMLCGILEAEKKGVLKKIQLVGKGNCFTFSELRCLQEVYQLLGYIHKLTVNLEGDNDSPGMLTPALEWIEESLNVLVSP